MLNINKIKRILKAQLGLEVPSLNQYKPYKYYLNNIVNSVIPELVLEQEAREKLYLQLYNLQLQNNQKNLQQWSLQMYGSIDPLNNSQDLALYGYVPNPPVSYTKAYTDSQNSNNLPIIEKVSLNKPTISTELMDKHIEEEKAKISAEQEAKQKAYQEKIKKWQNDSEITTTGNIYQGATAVIDTVGDAFGSLLAATNSLLTNTLDTTYDGVTTAVEKLGPLGKVIGGALKTYGALGDIALSFGGGTDLQTTTDKWMDSSFFSWNIGMLNGFAGKNSDNFAIDLDIIAKAGGSYGGATDAITDASETAGKKYGLFSSKSRKEANANIARAKAIQNKLGSITNTAEDLRLAAASMGEQAGLAYSLMTDGGYNLKYTYAAKQGGVLKQELLEWEPQIELNWDLSNQKEEDLIEWIPEFKQGGSIKSDDIPEKEETTQKNVIPEGALHKNKHHMEHAEGLTKKGIPVIDEDGELQAEIEKEEIIFTLEVTKQLEEYYKIFYSEDSTNKEKEQAAFLAGKLLVYEILENTDDRAGLIESCKLGGILAVKNPIDAELTPKRDIQKDLIKEAIKEVILELISK